MTGETVPLGEVARFIRGVTYKPGDVVADGAGGIACLRTKNIQSTLDLTDLVHVRSDLRHRVEQRVQVDDVLVSSANSWHLVGRAVQAGADAEGMLIGGFIGGLRFKPDVNPRYGYYWFSSPAIQAKVRSFGQQTTNISNLNVERTLGLRIPLPPLPEQRRIAAILDEADALRERKAAAEHLAQGTLHGLMGYYAREARPTRLGDVFRVSGGKRLAKGSEYSSVPTAHPYLRVTDMKSGEFRRDGLKFITPEVHRSIARYVVAAGDLVVSIAGTIGAVAVVPDDLAGANLTENAARLAPHTESAVDTTFVRAVIAATPVQDQIRRSTGQVTIGKLPLYRIEDLQLPLPPLQQQREFSSRVRALGQLRARLSERSESLNALFASLQHRAFRGDL